MFSAFSFGKIIKTILPGAILTAGLLFLVECLWAVWRPGRGFLLGSVPQDWITPATAALIPLSLILGFFLNTFTWTILNRKMRARCDKELDRTIYPALRQQLSANLWADSARYLDKFSLAASQASLPSRPPLEYYYLPIVTLTNLNYLWESYFCWYEFDINSACALMLTMPATGLLLWIKLELGQFLLLVLLMLPILTLSYALYNMLTRSAVKNLVSYERNLLLLIIGSLANASNNSPGSPEADTSGAME